MIKKKVNKFRAESYHSVRQQFLNWYKLEKVTQKEYEELCEDVRYLNVEKILWQTPISDDSTLWVMAAYFRDTLIFIKYVTPDDAIVDLVRPEFLTEVQKKTSVKDVTDQEYNPSDEEPEGDEFEEELRELGIDE